MPNLRHANLNLCLLGNIFKVRIGFTCIYSSSCRWLLLLVLIGSEEKGLAIKLGMTLTVTLRGEVFWWKCISNWLLDWDLGK